ncbi:YbhB/YbcL family Raf kinase inhibitor-like protein [Agrobacterium sp. MOPV5]|nr:YbhB/YbcL family Raf kinase inhibitor-like protein [Agrobacterium leguminum]
MLALGLTGSLFTITGAQAAKFIVTSTETTVDGKLTQAQFANSFGCTGGNISPQISWKNAPKGTKSFAISMYDPDAPTGSGLWHWVVINIPASVSELPQGVGSQAGRMPEGVLTTNNDAGAAGFLGACPPEGQTHRYVITVKALSVEKLDLPANTSGAIVGFMTNAKKLGEATITFKARR